VTTRKRPGAPVARLEASVVADHIEAAEEPARSRLRVLRDAIRKVAPNPAERIAYGLATWHEGENLAHLGASTQSVGVYPGAAAIVAFADELSASKTTKGAIQLPHDARLPVALVARITRWCVAQAKLRPATTTAAQTKTKKTKATTATTTLRLPRSGP